MAAQGKSIMQGGIRAGVIVAGVAAVLVAVLAPRYAGFVEQVHFAPHAPDFSRVAEAPLIVRLHLTAALTALTIGIALMMRVKGTAVHKLLGWTWVLAMGTTAVSSLFIRELNHGAFSFIHLLSGWTIIGLPGAVYAIKRGRVAAHRRAMTGMFVGGLLLAGLFAFIPGRLLWTVFLG